MDSEPVKLAQTIKQAEIFDDRITNQLGGEPTNGEEQGEEEKVVEEIIEEIARDLQQVREHAILKFASDR